MSKPRPMKLQACETFNITPPKNSPGFSLEFFYWYDRSEARWYARLEFNETRQGKQYGGKVIESVRSHPGCSPEQFMATLRNYVANRGQIFWT